MRTILCCMVTVYMDFNLQIFAPLATRHVHACHVFVMISSLPGVHAYRGSYSDSASGACVPGECNSNKKTTSGNIYPAHTNIYLKGFR